MSKTDPLSFYFSIVFILLISKHKIHKSQPHILNNMLNNAGVMMLAHTFDTLPCREWGDLNDEEFT